MRNLAVYFVALIAGIAFLVFGAIGATAAPWLAIDADTIKQVSTAPGEKRAKTTRTVRIWGIDAPEYAHRARCDRERDMGEAARSEVARLLAEAKHVRIDHRTGRDKYGRELAGVVVTMRDRTKVDVGAHLIGIGLARAYLGHGKRPDWCNTG